MEKFKIEFDGKSYDAVEINGACVNDKECSYDTIGIAEMGRNDARIDYILGTDKKCDAERIGEGIFGCAPKDLILDGGEEELGEYIKGLL